jgi:ABC-type phosphate transport system substrate-binding protein
MKMLKQLIVVCALALSTSFAGGYVAVVNSDAGVTALTKADAAAIYLGKKEQWDNGTKIKPCYLKKGAPSSKEFFSEVVGVKVKKFKKVWLKKVFAGYGTEPNGAGSVADVVSYVKSNSGAIGVVPADKAAGLSGVTTIPLN